jgi:hypothetical protein
LYFVFCIVVILMRCCFFVLLVLASATYVCFPKEKRKNFSVIQPPLPKIEDSSTKGGVGTVSSDEDLLPIDSGMNVSGTVALLPANQFLLQDFSGQDVSLGSAEQGGRRILSQKSSQDQGLSPPIADKIWGIGKSPNALLANKGSDCEKEPLSQLGHVQEGQRVLAAYLPVPPKSAPQKRVPVSTQARTRGQGAYVDQGHSYTPGPPASVVPVLPPASAQPASQSQFPAPAQQGSPKPTQPAIPKGVLKKGRKSPKQKKCVRFNEDSQSSPETSPAQPERTPPQPSQEMVQEGSGSDDIVPGSVPAPPPPPGSIPPPPPMPVGGFFGSMAPIVKRDQDGKLVVYYALQPLFTIPDGIEAVKLGGWEIKRDESGEFVCQEEAKAGSSKPEFVSDSEKKLNDEIKKLKSQKKSFQDMCQNLMIHIRGLKVNGFALQQSVEEAESLLKELSSKECLISKKEAETQKESLINELRSLEREIKNAKALDKQRIPQFEQDIQNKTQVLESWRGACGVLHNVKEGFEACQGPVTKEEVLDAIKKESESNIEDSNYPIAKLALEALRDRLCSYEITDQTKVLRAFEDLETLVSQGMVMVQDMKKVLQEVVQVLNKDGLDFQTDDGPDCPALLLKKAEECVSQLTQKGKALEEALKTFELETKPLDAENNLDKALPAGEIPTAPSLPANLLTPDNVVSQKRKGSPKPQKLTDAVSEERIKEIIEGLDKLPLRERVERLEELSPRECVEFFRKVPLKYINCRLLKHLDSLPPEYTKNLSHQRLTQIRIQANGEIKRLLAEPVESFDSKILSIQQEIKKLLETPTWKDEQDSLADHQRNNTLDMVKQRTINQLVDQGIPEEGITLSDNFILTTPVFKQQKEKENQLTKKLCLALEKGKGLYTRCVKQYLGAAEQWQAWKEWEHDFPEEGQERAFLSYKRNESKRIWFEALKTLQNFQTFAGVESLMKCHDEKHEETHEEKLEQYRKKAGAESFFKTVKDFVDQESLLLECPRALSFICDLLTQEAHQLYDEIDRKIEELEKKTAIKPKIETIDDRLRKTTHQLQSEGNKNLGLLGEGFDKMWNQKPTGRYSRGEDGSDQVFDWSA